MSENPANPASDKRSSIPRASSALTAVDSLPLLRSGTWLTGADSHDVNGGNNDGFYSTYSYRYRDGEEYVLFEDDGPGCIYEIRTVRFEGDLRIYIDGAASPQHVIPFKDLYSGERPPFTRPLVGDEETDHGSSWSYVPIPYTTGCRVTTTEMAPPKFYNIFAHRFREPSSAGSFTPETPLADVAAMWARPDKAFPPHPGSEVTRKSLTVEPSAVAVLADIAGEGVIRKLRLRCADPDTIREMATNLVMRAYWDGQIHPQINSPVGSFFGMGCPRALRAAAAPRETGFEPEHRHTTGSVPPLSLAVGLGEDGWLYCNLPMPYWKSARLELLNSSPHRPFDIECEFERHPAPYPAGSGYLHAQWRDETPLRPGTDYCVVETTGWGHYIGCVLTMSTCAQDSPYRTFFVRGHLEGDARFYIDDSRTPFVASTGTEEYFNWGWYDLPKHDSPFSYPTHGYPLHVADNEDHSVMCRFHWSDIVPFYRSFRFDLEHGGAGLDVAHYSGTAFYYRRPDPALLLTDELSVGDDVSENAHAYVCDGDQSLTRLTTLPYEGSYQIPPTPDAPRDREHTVSAIGRIWKGSSAFTVRIDPQNEGVKLRRRSYYGFGAEGDLSEKREGPKFTTPQAVSVHVDDQHVGDWRLPPAHARATWLDTDFEIPPDATRGKESIRIRLVSQDTTWDEYTYWVYSYADRTRE